MTSTVAGALIGAILAVSWILFGFWWFLFVALFMAIGAIVARVVAGELDLKALASAFSGRRTS